MLLWSPTNIPLGSPNPTLILVANSYAAFRAAQGEHRVCACGVPATPAPILTPWRAAAVALCGTGVLASPLYRACRSPHRRIPGAWGPSLPARGDLPPPGVCDGCVNGVQSPLAPRPHAWRPRLAGGGGLAQLGVFDPMGRALLPLRRREGLPPGRGHHGEAVQRRAEWLADALQPSAHANRGSPLRRVRA
jgi:hypothetical protein